MNSVTWLVGDKVHVKKADSGICEDRHKMITDIELLYV
jgi:hypothetical protein